MQGTSLSEATRAHRIGRTSSEFSRTHSYQSSRAAALQTPSMGGPVFTDMSVSSSSGPGSCVGELHQSQSYPIGNFSSHGHGGIGETLQTYGNMHPFKLDAGMPLGSLTSACGGGPASITGHSLASVSESYNMAGSDPNLTARERQSSGEALSGGLSYGEGSPHMRPVQGSLQPSSSIMSGDYGAHVDAMAAEGAVPPAAGHQADVRQPVSKACRMHL